MCRGGLVLECLVSEKVNDHISFIIPSPHPSLSRLADELAQTIVQVRNYLGPGLMPLDMYHVFSRGIFEVNNKTVMSGQYYEVTL